MKPKCNFLTLLILIMDIPYLCIAKTGTCTKKNSCKCAYEDGAIVDLSSLGKSDGSARFADVAGELATTLYSWNPCTSFTEGTCEDVAACQIQEDLPPAIYKPLGSQESAKFIVDDDGNLAIQYEAEEKGVLTTTVVSLICDENTVADFKVIDEGKTSAKFILGLKSQHACPTGITSDHLSVGTYLIIIFSSFVVFFFIAGIMFQKFIRKKSGKEVIPCVKFWQHFPGYIKDGVLLIDCRGKRLGYEKP